MLLLCLALLIGFLILFWSADQFVYSATATARNLNMSAMLIGLTLVSLGTSAPEVFVAVASAFEGAPQLAVGNSIGSNIANIGMVLGITALLIPLPFRVEVLRRDLPILIIVTAGAGFALANLFLGMFDALFLFTGLGLFLLRLVREHQRTYSMERAAAISDLDEIPEMSTQKSVAIFVVSLILLLSSAELLVWSATEIATRMGVSELIIGLTVIAVGTSLPELVVSVSCALKGQTDLAIGNIVGSNIFNILLVLAIPGLLAPSVLEPQILWRDYLLMFMMTLLLVLFAYGVRSKAMITRLEGGFLLLIWVAYLFSLYHSSLS
jgi:cation:H+ antiporter